MTEKGLLESAHKLGLHIAYPKVLHVVLAWWLTQIKHCHQHNWATLHTARKPVHFHVQRINEFTSKDTSQVIRETIYMYREHIIKEDINICIEYPASCERDKHSFGLEISFEGVLHRSITCKPFNWSPKRRKNQVSQPRDLLWLPDRLMMSCWDTCDICTCGSIIPWLGHREYFQWEVVLTCDTHSTGQYHEHSNNLIFPIQMQDHSNSKYAEHGVHHEHFPTASYFQYRCRTIIPIARESLTFPLEIIYTKFQMAIMINPLCQMHLLKLISLRGPHHLH